MSFIPPPSQIRMMMAEAPPDALNLAIGEPQFPTPKMVRDFVRENIDNWNLGYSANAGLLELRELIARSISSSVKTEQVCVTCGAQEALYVACHTLLTNGDEALVPNPGFLAYGSLTRMVGAEPIAYSMPISPNEPFDLESIAKKISARTKAIFINSPSNPTGFAFDRNSLQVIANLCARHRITIISDEIYRELYYSDKRPAGIADYSDVCIVISSLSKMFSMTGWRLGWAVCPPSIASSFVRVHQYLTTCASVVSQRAAVFVFEGHANQALEEMRAELAIRRDLLVEGLIEKNVWQAPKPGAGLFLFVPIPERINKDSVTVASMLAQQNKVVTVPGSAFGSRGEYFLRFSFAAGIEAIQEACVRLPDFGFEIVEAL